MKTKRAIELINIYTGWDLNPNSKREQIIELLKLTGKKFEKDDDYIDRLPDCDDIPADEKNLECEVKYEKS